MKMSDYIGYIWETLVGSENGTRESKMNTVVIE